MHLFLFNFYVKFGLIILIAIFLIIFLMDLFFTISSLNILFDLIFTKTFYFI